MRVLLLNQTFYPDHAATAQHAHDLARHLVAAGHEVVVIASRSTYGAKGAGLPARETVDGADVHRVGLSLFGKGSLLARAADFGLFYVAAGVRALTLARPDVVVPFTTPPLIVGVGWLTRRLRGVPYVYWVMDLYPDLAVSTGVLRRGGPIEHALEAVSRRCLRGAARVVVLGRCMRERVLEKGVAPQRVEIINVWADRDEIRPVPCEDNPLRRQWGVGDALVVMYSGNLGLGHGTAAILDAMTRLRDRDDVRFVFIGGGKRMAEVERTVRERGLTNASFHPYQPRERLSESLGAGDVHLISQRQDLTGMLVPSKLYGVLAAARPVLFIGGRDAEAARVIDEAGCGVVIAEGDGEALAEAIVALAEDRPGREAMGERGRAVLASRFDRSLACSAWEEVLRAAVESPDG